jgi:uncharacterized LabA/DUF88 family protein
MNQRVMIFIDGSNLFWAYRALNFKIDLKKLVEEQVKDRYLLRNF